MFDYVCRFFFFEGDICGLSCVCVCECVCYFDICKFMNMCHNVVMCVCEFYLYEYMSMYIFYTVSR